MRTTFLHPQNHAQTVQGEREPLRVPWVPIQELVEGPPALARFRRPAGSVLWEGSVGLFRSKCPIKNKNSRSTLIKPHPSKIRKIPTNKTKKNINIYDLKLYMVYLCAWCFSFALYNHLLGKAAPSSQPAGRLSGCSPWGTRYGALTNKTRGRVSGGFGRGEKCQKHHI